LQAVSLLNNTVRESLVIIEGLDLFIGPDTSFLHLASCMGVPAVGIYGATDSELFYPLFHKKFIAVSPAALDCKPCYPGPHGGSCGAVGPYAVCMEAVTPEQVMCNVRAVLGSADTQTELLCSQ
jgi:ADP-heptose:LPS heptosyltransferase